MIVNNYALSLQTQAIQQMQMQRTLTVSTNPSPFGAFNYFDRCTDELMGLHFTASLPLLDWIGWEVSDEYTKPFEYLTFVRPTVTNGTASAGHLSDACADPNSWEFGTNKFTVSGFGRYGRRGPTRDIMKPMMYCKTDPRRRLDGAPVTDEREWDMRFTTEVILQDISRDVIVGNSSTAGKMNGLEQIVKTGYSSSMLDSIVIDWNGNPMSGGSGVTWNGGAVASTYNFVDVLRSVVRRIRQRISWAPMVSNQRMNIGDMILVMPTHVAECLLDFYTCWSVCTSTDDITIQLQSFEARRFRDQLLGGLFGYGQITIDGIPIPILAYDYELIKGPTLSDVYLLTGSIGSVKLWFGEHLAAEQAARQYGNLGYFSTDGGRILGLYYNENECVSLREWMHPRMYTRAPWAQARFQDVFCSRPGGPLSGDPLLSSFYPLSSFGGDLAP